MQETKVLETTLKEGLFLVQQVVSGEISIQEFVKKYNNFYYYNALDGHEANESTLDLFSKYSQLIELHRRVQMEVVNLVFLGNKNDLPQYLEAGRITPDEARRRIKNILREFSK